jgi:hypothetical protein
MTNEIEFKLKQVQSEITQIENQAPQKELLVVASSDFNEGYLHALYDMREWLQGIIINYCE